MRVRYAVVIAVLTSLLTWVVIGAQVAVNPVGPRVMTGADLGFRVEGLRGKAPVGRVVIRVNGQWVDAEVLTVPGPLAQ